MASAGCPQMATADISSIHRCVPHSSWRSQSPRQTHNQATKARPPARASQNAHWAAGQMLTQSEHKQVTCGAKCVRSSGFSLSSVYDDSCPVGLLGKCLWGLWFLDWSPHHLLPSRMLCSGYLSDFTHKFSGANPSNRTSFQHWNKDAVLATS